MWDWRNVALLAMGACLVWFGSAIVRLENYRYAASLGFCSEYSAALQYAEREACMAKAETRTSPVFHLLYGLKVIG